MGIQHYLKTCEFSDDVVEVTDEILIKIQNKLLEFMKDIAEVCQKYGIKWCLSGGSALGAVRHKGFIPWDDDIDIFMERQEYEKFRNIFSIELSKKYVLKQPGDDGYLNHFPQIHKKGTKLKLTQSYEGEDGGLFIDIFILENTYNSSILRAIHGIKSTILLYIDSSVRMEICKKNILHYTNGNKNIKRELTKRTLFSLLFRFKSLEEWLELSDKCFSEVRKKTNFYVCPSGINHFFGEIYDSTMFEVLEVREFEGETWYVPSPPEEYLKKRYGDDFMTIPSRNNRERHVYVVLDLGDD